MEFFRGINYTGRWDILFGVWRVKGWKGSNEILYMFYDDHN
jgi:hypothetical protein